MADAKNEQAMDRAGRQEALQQVGNRGCIYKILVMAGGGVVLLLFTLFMMQRCSAWVFIAGTLAYLALAAWAIVNIARISIGARRVHFEAELGALGFSGKTTWTGAHYKGTLGCCKSAWDGPGTRPPASCAARTAARSP